MEKTRILTKEIQMSLDDKITKRNNHVFITAKTREEAMNHYLLPNILQMNSNYVIVDPGGYIYNRTKQLLEKQGYRIQNIHLMDPENSLHFNPFHSVVDGERLIRGYSKSYQVVIEGPEKKHEAKQVIIQTEDRVVRGDGGQKGLTAMVDTILMATDSIVGHGDAALKKFEKHFLLALALYVAEVYEKKERHIWKISELLERLDVLDTRMKELQNQNFTSKAAQNYKLFQMGAEMIGGEKIVASVKRRLQIFENDFLKVLMQDSTVDFDAFGEEKQVLFIIASEEEESHLITAILVQQLEERLREYTERACDGYRLPVPMTLVLNLECASAISDINMRVGTSRKYNIGYCFIDDSEHPYIQNVRPEWEFLAGACDTFLYLGTSHESIHNFVIGQMKTEFLKNRALQLEDDECVVLMKGQAPLIGKKYVLKEHSRLEKVT